MAVGWESCFRGLWVPFGNALEVFGWILGTIVFTLGAIGVFYGVEWLLFVSWGPLWEVLEGPWVHFEVTWYYFGCLGHLKWILRTIWLT